MAPTTLTIVGGVEALWGAYLLLFPSQTLSCTIGHLLSVGAPASSPALLPTMAQVGALRLSIGLLILSIATSHSANGGEAVHTFEAAAVAHACLLQPFVATCRTHPRLPVGNMLLLSLLEGGAIVGGMAYDLDFDVHALAKRPVFLAAAAFLVAGVMLALLALMRKTCCARSPKTSDELAGQAQTSYGATPLLDEERFKLSPASKRLLG